MVSIKNRIIDFMKDKEKVHLKEIYNFLELKPTIIRSVINIEVKKQRTFERLGKGYYKIKWTK